MTKSKYKKIKAVDFDSAFDKGDVTEYLDIKSAKARFPTQRNIGQEILAGIREIKEWQQGKKKLKTTHVQLPRAADVATQKKKSYKND